MEKHANSYPYVAISAHPSPGRRATHSRENTLLSKTDKIAYKEVLQEVEQLALEQKQLIHKQEDIRNEKERLKTELALYTRLIEQLMDGISTAMPDPDFKDKND